MFKLFSLFAVLLFSFLNMTSVCVAQVVIDQAAPDVELQVPEQSVRLHALQGQVVYIDFWASWCGPCRKSFPWMNDIQNRYRSKGLKIIAVNVDSDSQLARAFLQEHPAKFDIAYDAKGQLASQFGVSVMPSSYLIDRQGKVVFVHKGFLEKDTAELERRIQSVLAK